MILACQCHKHVLLTANRERKIMGVAIINYLISTSKLLRRVLCKDFEKRYRARTYPFQSLLFYRFCQYYWISLLIFVVILFWRSYFIIQLTSLQRKRRGIIVNSKVKMYGAFNILHSYSYLHTSLKFVSVTLLEILPQLQPF